ncbi:mycofactocin system transcriptional regulator [Kineococcus aurantiacus]|uniref:Mycofactocin system transcriptional regulator n=1 Tax=Kineococcus aurantiacus TaxID=37633 RepID=A0A7Y9DQT1_9ACTN|nr:mycofactocin system transcriptional regulator [Kineococcus aurantiacus]
MSPTHRRARTATTGRPEATTHAAIEAAAFALFDERGFEETTMTAIAAAVGVAPRTLFRYYPSKNDIPWGQFEETLAAFRAVLAATPATTSLVDGIHAAVLSYNAFPDETMASHRRRMGLILGTPALQAHSVLKYRAWREVISQHVARCCGGRPADLFPQTVGHVSLALALTAYEAWLSDERASLADLIDEALRGLRVYVSADRGARDVRLRP